METSEKEKRYTMEVIVYDQDEVDFLRIAKEMGVEIICKEKTSYAHSWMSVCADRVEDIFWLGRKFQSAIDFKK